ncbi:MAG: hypothetical protein Q8P41_11305 [Pseudomonadota bacterium]|nr:hypothetical protein [Pseudomonadota bacterium]
MSPASALLAVLMPVAIVAGTLGYWGRADAPGEGAAEPPEVTACLQTVERAGDDVVIVGNSKAGTDVDRAVLARALGVKDIAKVGGPGSSAPLWYASLERCVFEAGHTPKLVIVYGTAGAMLRTTLDSELERMSLARYLGDNEPVLDQKVFGGEPVSPFWQRVRTRKTSLLQGFQHGIRDGIAGLFFAPPSPDGLLAAGRAHAVPALEKVLGADAGAEAVTRHRAIPIAEAATAERTARDTDVADTLVPDLVALAHDHGARIVFAQAPLSAAKVDVYDRSDPALVRAMVDALNQAGAGYLDLADLRLPPSAYGDGIHMNSSGRTTLSAALADRLVAMGAMGAAPFGPAPLPRSPATVTRRGEPPTLPAPPAPKRGPWECGWQLNVKGLEGISDTVLGKAGIGAASPLLLAEDGTPLLPHAAREAFDLSCAGGFSHQAGSVKFSPTGGPAEVVPSRAYTLALSDDVPLRDPFGRELYWVYPGTTLRADAAQGFDAPVDGFAVYVEAHVAIPGTSPATVSWVGGSAPLAVEGAAGSATVAGAAPTAAWGVEVTSPPDGPWLLVRRIVAGTDAAPWYLLGAPDSGRTVEMLRGELAYAAAPPPLGPLGKALPTREGGFRFEATALGAPDGDTVYKQSGISACSPVVVLEDGVPLPAPNSPLRIVKEGGGAYAHTAFGILFSAPDGASPIESGRTYTAILNPDRACRSGRWIYPGDIARFTVGADPLRRLSTAATRLDLTVSAFGGTDPTAAMTARVIVGTETVFEGTAPFATLDATPPSWVLPVPIPATAEGVVVELSTPAGAPFAMVTALSLVEPPRAAFPGVPVAVAAPPPTEAPAVRGAGAGAVP